MSVSRTVVGSGTTALAAALFASRYGPVDLYARIRSGRSRSVESIPAAALTLLVELGITPDELDVAALCRRRVVAWQDAVPRERDGPACAHIDTAALHNALVRSAADNPDITFGAEPDHSALPPGWVDATGRRAVSALRHVRPPRTWTAALVTVPSTEPGELRLAAAHDGYVYRLGSAHWTSIGWVGPDRPPLSGGELRDRIAGRGAAWLLDGVDVPEDCVTYRRAASAAVPEPSGAAVAVGDAALARDALASQGVSIGLSDACLAADPATTRRDMARRRDEAVSRHFRHLAEMAATCRYAQAPAWSAYLAWIDHADSQRPPRPTDPSLSTPPSTNGAGHVALRLIDGGSRLGWTPIDDQNDER